MKILRDSKHRYTVDGREYPGVTTIIGRTLNRPELNAWRVQQGKATADAIARKAADHGTFVHMLAALHADGETYLPIGDGAEDALGASTAQIDAFRAWYDEHVVECIGVELFVAHPVYQYAGALDLLVRLRGDKMWTVVDVKTGKRVYIDSRAQCMAYLMAARACGLVKGRGRRGVLWLPSGDDAGKCEFKEYTNPADEQAFLSMLFLWRWLDT